MRIAVLIPYGRHGGYSGPAVSMERIFAAVSDTHDVTVVCNPSAAPPQGYPWADRTVGIRGTKALGSSGGMGPLNLLGQLAWAWATTWWLWRHAREFDVVHLHGGYLFNLVSAGAARRRSVPYVILPLAATGDLAIHSRSARIRPIAWLRRRVISNAAIGYVLADQIAEEFVHWGMEWTSIVAIGNPVDTDRFRPAFDPRSDPRSSMHTLCFVGKIGHRKRALLLLDTLRVLRERGYADAAAVLIGPFESPEFEQEFRRQLAAKQLTNSVQCVGHVLDVETYLREQVSVFVLPSAQEGLPGALVEAMAAGLPSVVTDVGSMGDVVRAAGSGKVVPPSADSLADEIMDLWASAEMWLLRSRRAREYALQHFSVDAVARNYLSALRFRR